MLVKAIDVSINNLKIDWKKVKRCGIGAAMVKASQGLSEVNPKTRLFMDGRFTQNVDGACAVGIHVGAYHYLTARTVEEAKEEARYFLSVLGLRRSSLTLWAAVDVESKYLPEDRMILTQIVLAFCDEVKSGGYTPCIYTNPSFMKYRLGDISKYPLWLALWGSNTAQWDAPQEVYAEQRKTQYPNAVMWQWGAYKSGVICGTECDGDYVLTDIAAKKTVSASVQFKVGDKVKAVDSAVYTNGNAVPLWVRLLPLYVRGVNGENITVSVLKTGAVTGIVNQKYLKKA